MTTPHTSGDPGFVEKNKESGLTKPEIPTAVEQAPHGFKSRFLPVFDPNVGIFRAVKSISVEHGIYRGGEYVFPMDAGIDGRRLRLLFSQRYLEYPSNEDVEKMYRDPKTLDEYKTKAKEKAAANRAEDVENEKKVEDARKVKAAAEYKKSLPHKESGRSHFDAG